MFVVLNWIKTPYTFGLSYFVQFSKVYVISETQLSRLIVCDCRSNFYILANSQMIVNYFLKVFRTLFSRGRFSNSLIITCCLLFVNHFFCLFLCETNFNQWITQKQLRYLIMCQQTCQSLILRIDLFVFRSFEQIIIYQHQFWKSTKKRLIYQHF